MSLRLASDDGSVGRPPKTAADAPGRWRGRLRRLAVARQLVEARRRRSHVERIARGNRHNAQVVFPIGGDALIVAYRRREC
jgi:hypothetical protein